MTFKRRGAETGSGFQDAINRTNEAYEKFGRACITRKAIPGKYLIDRVESRRGLSLPAMDVASPGSQARLTSSSLKGLIKRQKIEDWRKFVPESKAEPDYGGAIAPEGRAIYYDAKTTRREALDFDNLHAHQIEFLRRVANVGAIAGFLVEFSTRKEVYFLPIQLVLAWRENSTRKSIPHQFFCKYLTLAPPGKGLLIFDYLVSIEDQEKRYEKDYARFYWPAPSPRRASNRASK